MHRSSFSSLPECARTSVTNEAIATTRSNPGRVTHSLVASAAAPVPPEALARGLPGNGVSRGPDLRTKSEARTTTPSRDRGYPSVDFSRCPVVGKLCGDAFSPCSFSNSLPFPAVFSLEETCFYLITSHN